MRAVSPVPTTRIRSCSFCEVLEAARPGEGLEYGDLSFEHVGARGVDFSHDEEFGWHGLDDDDGDDGVRVVFLERRRQPVAQLARCCPGGGDVADERQRDLSVGTDLQRLRQCRVLVDLDAELVTGDEAVVAGRPGCGRSAGWRRRGWTRRGLSENTGAGPSRMTAET